MTPTDSPNSPPGAPAAVAELSPRDEARRLTAMYGGDTGMPAVMTLISNQLQVLQQRSQLLLTLSTLTLTITGFSGPKIAGSSLFARYTMAAGLVLVLTATVVVLVSSLRIRWVTQFTDGDGQTALERILAYRNGKTRAYRVELLLLVVGLGSYVSSVIAYLLQGGT